MVLLTTVVWIVWRREWCRRMELLFSGVFVYESANERSAVAGVRQLS